MERQLIYVPIIHTAIDMGSLAESLKKEYIQKYGMDNWHQHLKKIDDLWADIENCIDQKHLHYHQVRIYQDGLPICGNELQIVQDIAKRGGRNHQLLLKYVNKGAILMGTEDPSLLVKEYQLIKNTTAGKINKKDRMKHNYLPERDSFIARRIDETLKNGETGILFLGMLHNIVKKLASDITVEYLKIPAIKEFS